eukprot:11221714-Lingulodinium_polyedra.AAC.1
MGAMDALSSSPRSVLSCATDGFASPSVHDAFPPPPAWPRHCEGRCLDWPQRRPYVSTPCEVHP